MLIEIGVPYDAATSGDCAGQATRLPPAFRHGYRVENILDADRFVFCSPEVLVCIPYEISQPSGEMPIEAVDLGK